MIQIGANEFFTCDLEKKLSVKDNVDPALVYSKEGAHFGLWGRKVGRFQGRGFYTFCGQETPNPTPRCQ